MSFPSVRPGVWASNTGYIWKNIPCLVSAWKALYAHFPASTLIDVVSDSEQATNLAQLSRPCRLCGGISNLCGVWGKKWEKEIRDIFVLQNKSPPYCLPSGRVKKCFYFEQSLRKHTLKSQPLLESSKGTFWHMKWIVILNETGTNYHLSRLSSFGASFGNFCLFPCIPMVDLEGLVCRIALGIADLFLFQALWEAGCLAASHQ